MVRYRTLLTSVSIVPLFVLGIAGWNYYAVQRPIDRALDADQRNAGISVRGHFSSYVNSGVLVVDIRDVPHNKAPIDVFRALLQIAAAFRASPFEHIELACLGKKKFVVRGDYFWHIGQEYGQQNPVFTIRTFPEHLYRPDGTAAYPAWSGGILGVLTHQMQDFSDFQLNWYIRDLVAANAGMPETTVLATDDQMSQPEQPSDTPAIRPAPSATAQVVTTSVAQDLPISASGQTTNSASSHTDDGPRVLTFRDQMRAVENAPKFYLDEIGHTYHVLQCPDARPKEMLLVIDAVITLKGYPPHSCVHQPPNSR